AVRGGGVTRRSAAAGGRGGRKWRGPREAGLCKGSGGSERRSVVGRCACRGLLRGSLLGGGLPGRLLRGLLRRCLLGRGLLRRGFLAGGGLGRGLPGHRLLRAEATTRRLAGLGQQLPHFLQGQRRRLAVLGDLAVELAVADVRAEAPVEHLDVAAREFLDDPVARDLLLLLDQLHGARQVDLVRIVLLLQRGVGAAALGEGTEAADADADLLAVALAQV